LGWKGEREREREEGNEEKERKREVRGKKRLLSLYETV